MRIQNKAKFNVLSQRGLLGNYLRTWFDLSEALESGARWFTIQGRAPSSPYFVPVVNSVNLSAMRDLLFKRGARDADIYFREIPHPSVERLANIEAVYLPIGLHVEYSLNSILNLRTDLRENGRAVVGIDAWRLLRAQLQEDFDMVMNIWDRYPDSVIELSKFARPVGALDRKVVIWEVRDF